MKKIIVLFLVVISILPISLLGGCDKKQVANCVYDISAEYVESGVIGADMEFTYYCDILEGTDVLKFNMFPNAFREDAKITPLEGVEKQYGEMSILSVFCEEQALEYEICGKDKNILKVCLSEMLCYGEKKVINIKFAVVLPSGNYRFCKGENTVNVGNWYPILCMYEDGKFIENEYTSIGDPFYTKVSDYKVKLTTPSKIIVAASGKATSCDVEGEKTSYSYNMKNVRDFAFCLSDKFEVISEICDGVIVNYYYYNDPCHETTFEITKRCLSYFSNTFGAYPFESFSVAESNFNEGGMEYSGLVYINAELNDVNKKYTVVHETAHQWWYGVVGNNQLYEAFLDEGITEYSTAIFFDENKDYNISAQAIFDSAKKYCSSYQEVLDAIGEKPNFTMRRNLSEFNGELEYVNIAYNRGLTMMKSAEDAVGRDQMKKSLAKYYKKYSYKIATTEDFVGSMKGVDKILMSYIEGKVAI